MKKLNKMSKIVIAALIASLAFNAALAYVHYVVQWSNVFTIGADYFAEVEVSWLNNETEHWRDKVVEFGVECGDLLGNDVSLYWGEMQHGSKWSPILNITNTSPDKAENITWALMDPKSGLALEAFFADVSGSNGTRWYPGAQGAVSLEIGESFDIVFTMQCDGMAVGTYDFDIDVRAED